MLNYAKSKELVFCVREVRARPVQPPPTIAAELCASKVSEFSVSWLMTG